jgi:hypothetical protein
MSSTSSTSPSTCTPAGSPTAMVVNEWKTSWNPPGRADRRGVHTRTFLLWQRAHSEFHFCEAYWPDFRQSVINRSRGHT